jgi:hypothetical protein
METVFSLLSIKKSGEKTVSKLFKINNYINYTKTKNIHLFLYKSSKTIHMRKKKIIIFFIQKYSFK